MVRTINGMGKHAKKTAKNMENQMGHMPEFPDEGAPTAPDADRRVGKRYTTVLKIGRAIFGKKDQLCLVRNFSQGGLKIDLPHEPHPDDRVTIELRSDRVLHGTVRWAHDHASGIQLDDPLRSEDILDNKAPSPLLRRRPRAPRFHRNELARIDYQGAQFNGAVADISLQGVCIESRPVGRRGEHVVLHIGGLPPRSAIVRWVGGGRMGFSFERPWSFAELADWLDAHEQPGDGTPD